MNNRLKFFYRGFMFLLLIRTSLHGELLNLDLQKACDIALQNNPDVKLAREGVQKSEERVREARGGLLPTLSGFSQYQHAWELPTFVMNFPDPLTGQTKVLKIKMGQENTIAYGLSFSQPVYLGGTLQNAYRLSRLGVNISKVQLKITEQKVVNEVTNAYYGLLFARSASEVTAEGLNSAQENLAQVKKFFDVGRASRFDVLRAEVQVANYQPMVVTARNAVRLAESALRMALGIADEIELNITEKLQYATTDYSNKALDELLIIALRERPELGLLAQQKQMADRQIALSKASTKPSLLFGSNYQFQGQRDDLKFVSDDFFKSFSSSFSLNVPLFAGFTNKAKIQQAKIARKEVDLQQESLINAIKLEVKSSYFSMKEADENVKSQLKTIDQAQEALRLAQIMYSEGASTQLDVLNANLAVNQAKMNYQKSLYEYNVALANLKKAINQL